jgi:hypothetical protein
MTVVSETDVLGTAAQWIAAGRKVASGEASAAAAGEAAAPATARVGSA